MTPIHEATSDVAIRACHPVLRELRPHLTDSEDFLARVRRQQQTGYRLIYVEEEGAAAACAGFRLTEHLKWGRALYVDDLICREISRGRGHATALMDWLEALARAEACYEMRLDSGFTRQTAHRFYHARGMAIVSLHFRKALG